MAALVLGIRETMHRIFSYYYSILTIKTARVMTRGRRKGLGGGRWGGKYCDLDSLLGTLRIVSLMGRTPTSPPALWFSNMGRVS